MSNVETIKVVPARYPLRTVGAVVALFIPAVVIQSVAFNPRWEWAVFARWFFDPVILAGVGQTLLLTLIGTALSVVIGGLLALARLSSSPAVKQPGVGLHLVVPLAAAHSRADHPLQLLLSLRHALARRTVHRHHLGQL